MNSDLTPAAAAPATAVSPSVPPAPAPVTSATVPAAPTVKPPPLRPGKKQRVAPGQNRPLR